MTDVRVRRIALETVERVTGKKVNAPTIQEWLDRWLRLEKDAISDASFKRYEQIARNFVKSLGPKAGAKAIKLARSNTPKQTHIC